MNVEAGATQCTIQDKPGPTPKHVGTTFKASRNRVEVAMAGMGFMITDWAALRHEIHQALQELKQSDGCWRQAKSDLEARIAVLDESIKSSNRRSVNILRNLRRSTPEQDRSLCWAGGVRTDALWTHKGAKQPSARPAA